MASKMSDPQELFLHELGDILGAEKLILKLLPKLASEASDRELKAGFKRHEKETREQIKNIEQAFKSLRKRVKAENCPAAQGLKKEHDDFMRQEKPEQDVANAFLTGAGARTEHYEIAAYTGLVTMARAMGEREAARLLNANLQQEKKMLQDVDKIAKRLAEAGAKKAQKAAAAAAPARSTARKRPAASRSRGTTARARSSSASRSSSSRSTAARRSGARRRRSS
jgi:ferritin-like metal-binding protein YciE